MLAIKFVFISNRNNEMVPFNSFSREKFKNENKDLIFIQVLLQPKCLYRFYYSPQSTWQMRAIFLVSRRINLKVSCRFDDSAPSFPT